MGPRDAVLIQIEDSGAEGEDAGVLRSKEYFHVLDLQGFQASPVEIEVPILQDSMTLHRNEVERARRKSLNLYELCGRTSGIRNHEFYRKGVRQPQPPAAASETP